MDGTVVTMTEQDIANLYTEIRKLDEFQQVGTAEEYFASVLVEGLFTVTPFPEHYYRIGYSDDEGGKFDFFLHHQEMIKLLRLEQIINDQLRYLFDNQINPMRKLQKICSNIKRFSGSGKQFSIVVAVDVLRCYASRTMDRFAIELFTNCLKFFESFMQHINEPKE